MRLPLLCAAAAAAAAKACGACGTCGSRRAAAAPPEARAADSEGHVGAWACGPGNGRGVEQEETEAAHAWRAYGPGWA